MARRAIARGAIVRRRQHGGKVDWKKVWGLAKKTHRFLRKTKGLSRAMRALDSAGVPYAGTVGRFAGKVGYGRRRKVYRRRRGGALRLAGAGCGGRKKTRFIMY